MPTANSVYEASKAILEAIRVEVRCATPEAQGQWNDPLAMRMLAALTVAETVTAAAA
jgi:hypothetical protein